MARALMPRVDVTVTVTHADRVLLPGDGITKGALVDYYAQVADAMMPHLEGRLAKVHA